MPNNASSWDIFHIKNNELIILYIYFQIQDFETVPNSKKLQMTTHMWLLTLSQILDSLQTTISNLTKLKDSSVKW